MYLTIATIVCVIVLLLVLWLLSYDLKSLRAINYNIAKSKLCSTNLKSYIDHRACQLRGVLNKVKTEIKGFPPVNAPSSAKMISKIDVAERDIEELAREAFDEMDAYCPDPMPIEPPMWYYAIAFVVAVQVLVFCLYHFDIIGGV